jgi:hypothetical protein
MRSFCHSECSLENIAPLLAKLSEFASCNHVMTSQLATGLHSQQRLQIAVPISILDVERAFDSQARAVILSAFYWPDFVVAGF